MHGLRRARPFSKPRSCGITTNLPTKQRQARISAIISAMLRPCFLVVDREFPGSISTRKLVIETAKFNVLTAYSAEEAMELLERSPAVSGVVIDDGIEGVAIEAL